MPLIINDTVIDYLNGPTTFTFLLPPKSSKLNYNIILLGDEHTTTNFVPCNSTPEVSNCFETIQFVELLNEYALRNRVDFYTEQYPTSGVMDKAITPIHTQLISEGQLVSKNFYNKSLTPRTAKTFRIAKMRNSEWSDMLILFRHIEACYYKNTYKKTELCPYKNIYWHFNDIRQSQKIKLNDIQFSVAIFENIHTKTLTPDIFLEVMDEFSVYKYNVIKILNLFIMYKEIIDNNPQIYINSLFQPSSPFFNPALRKQFDKILPQMKDVITMESFYQLFEYYMNFKKDGETMNPSVNQTNYRVISDILQELIDMPREIYDESIRGKLSSYSKGYLLKLCERLNEFSISQKTISDIVALALMSEIFLPDIYFIMRIFKQEKNNFDSNKLIVNYIGSNHNIGTTYFLSTFCGYNNIYEKTMEPDMRRIHIDKTINLNLFASSRQRVSRLRNEKQKSASSRTKNPRISSRKIRSAPKRISLSKKSR